MALFFVLVAMFGLIYSPYLSAGETLFKECKNCGHLNYQFSNTCSLCGESGRFEDVWLKEDCDKRDAKKKKAKDLSVIDHYHIKKHKCNMPDFDQEKAYELFIEPVNYLISVLKKESLKYPEEMKISEAIGSLMHCREMLLRQYELHKYHHE